MSILRIKAFLLALLFFGLVLTMSGARGQSEGRQSGDDVAAPIEPLSADIGETRLFTELLRHNELRNAALAGYTEQRTYQVTDMSGRVRAQESGQMEYRTPDKKSFATTPANSITTVRSLPRTTLWNFLASSRLGRIVAFSRARRQNGQINICLKEKCGLIRKTTPSFGSSGILPRNSHSGSSGSTSYANIKRLMDSGFHKRTRHTCKSECMGRRSSRSTIRTTS
jgi:hypothetical protein